MFQILSWQVSLSALLSQASIFKSLVCAIWSFVVIMLYEHICCRLWGKGLDLHRVDCASWIVTLGIDKQNMSYPGACIIYQVIIPFTFYLKPSHPYQKHTGTPVGVRIRGILPNSLKSSLILYKLHNLIVWSKLDHSIKSKSFRKGVPRISLHSA